ncbi:MAG: HAD family phosphatase, partial [Muribaculaceae bacterium]|nr:HAD family phosphatase [Muribaculaceae bacterium]
MTRDILFDLGGVIVDIRRQDCVEAFRRLGFDNIDSYLGEYGQQGPFLALEEGKITPAQLHENLRPCMPPGVTDAQIDDAFQAFITGIPLQRLQALRELRRKGHRLYVISNTNVIMWDGIISRCFRQEGLEAADYFDGIVTSFEAKCCKPDPRIFQLVLDRFGLDPREVTFFDDSADNCRA